MDFVPTSPFQLNQPQYSNRVVIPPLRPTEILVTSHGLPAAVSMRFFEIATKAGVMLLDLVTEADRQLSLGETPQSETVRQRSQQLMAPSPSSTTNSTEITFVSDCRVSTATGSCRYTAIYDLVIRACEDENIKNE